MQQHNKWRYNKPLDMAARFLRHVPIGRRMCFRLLHRLSGNPERFVGTLDEQRFSVDMKDTDICLRTYLWGIWEPPLTALWVYLLKPGMCVVDIGANKGYFSLLAAKRVLPGGRVISFEPYPRNFSDITKTIQENQYKHWTASADAVSSQNSTATLFAHGWDEGVSGWGTLEASRGPSDEKLNVKTTTLNTAMNTMKVQHIDLLKMDIEGHELEAILGAEELIKRKAISSITMEIHLKELGAQKLNELFEVFLDNHYVPRLLNESLARKINWSKINKGSKLTTPERLLRPVTKTELDEMDLQCRPQILWQPE